GGEERLVEGEAVPSTQDDPVTGPATHRVRHGGERSEAHDVRVAADHHGDACFELRPPRLQLAREVTDRDEVLVTEVEEIRGLAHRGHPEGPHAIDVGRRREPRVFDPWSS